VKIRRSRLTGDFLQVPNATVRDDRLSHMARGVLVELLSRPDGWEATADDMWRASVARHGKASPGRRAFRAAFAELKEHGYLTAGKDALPGGRYGTVLTLTDVPHAGMSVRPAETPETPAHSDVPHAGTSVDDSDVPHGGTSAPTGQMAIPAGRTDVPLSDVPHAGTSKEENGVTNTGKNTPTSVAPRAHDDAAASRYPAELTQLMDSMSLSGINLPWKFLGDDMIRVLNDIKRLGIPLMVEDAVSAKASATKPPFSSRFFYDRWHAIHTPAQPAPGERPPLRAVPGPPSRQDAALAQRNASRAFLDQLAEQLRASGDPL
jgi:hypothetical protein